MYAADRHCINPEIVCESQRPGERAQTSFGKLKNREGALQPEQFVLVEKSEGEFEPDQSMLASGDGSDSWPTPCASSGRFAVVRPATIAGGEESGTTEEVLSRWYT